MLTQKKICQYWISYYFMTGLQLYKRVAGECMKCHCPEYKPPSKFNARRGWITHYEQQRMMFLKKDVLDVGDF